MRNTHQLSDHSHRVGPGAAKHPFGGVYPLAPRMYRVCPRSRSATPCPRHQQSPVKLAAFPTVFTDSPKTVKNIFRK